MTGLFVEKNRVLSPFFFTTEESSPDSCPVLSFRFFDVSLNILTSVVPWPETSVKLCAINYMETYVLKTNTLILG